MTRRNRRYLRRRGIRHTIPERHDQQRHRKNRGSRGGRPTGFDLERYKKRNTVERAINRLKGFRAVATRYEKRAYIYLGTLTLLGMGLHGIRGLRVEVLADVVPHLGQFPVPAHGAVEELVGFGAGEFCSCCTTGPPGPPRSPVPSPRWRSWPQPWECW
ncbi:transposase [Streptomyces sp. NRRL B-1677]|nr:transposase [Streptomyces sp. NRRL B-1677]